MMHGQPVGAGGSDRLPVIYAGVVNLWIPVDDESIAENPQC
jgi:hypothetical protein